MHFTSLRSYSVVQEDNAGVDHVTNLPSIFAYLEVSKPADQSSAHSDIPASNVNELDDLDDSGSCSSADILDTFEKKYAL